MSITAERAAAMLGLQAVSARHQPQEANQALNICRKMACFSPCLVFSAGLFKKLL